MSVPLIIDSGVETRLNLVKQLADNPTRWLGFRRLKQLAADPHHRPLGDTYKDQNVFVPVCFNVFITVECQPGPLGWCWHISLSSMRSGRIIHPMGVELLLGAMSFKSDMVATSYEEKLPEDRIAVNLLIMKDQDRFRKLVEESKQKK